MRSLIRPLLILGVLAFSALGATPAQAQTNGRAQVRRAPAQANLRAYTPSASDRAWFAHPSTQRSFPRLGSSYRIIGPQSSDYNCIAHTIGERYWEWPGNSVSNFDRLYGRYGYRRLPTMDLSHKPGVSKIVLYALPKSDGRLEATHGALQTRSGNGWTSKLGRGPTIWHATPHHLSGPTYGVPVHVYAR